MAYTRLFIDYESEHIDQGARMYAMFGLCGIDFAVLIRNFPIKMTKGFMKMYLIT